MRLLTRKGNKSRAGSRRSSGDVAAGAICLIDGETIVSSEDGLAVFELIREYRHDTAVVLCALDQKWSDDLGRMPIEQHKRLLAKLLSHSP